MIPMISIVRNEANSDSCGNPAVFGAEPVRICMLDALNLSDRATVIEMNTSKELQNRLMGIGLTLGAKVEILHGGHNHFKPLVIGVGESRIAIGRDIAKMVLVESDTEGPP